MFDPHFIEFQCPSCDVTLKVPVKFVNVTGPCPKCGATVTAPFASGSSKAARLAGEKPEDEIAKLAKVEVPKEMAPPKEELEKLDKEKSVPPKVTAKKKVAKDASPKKEPLPNDAVPLKIPAKKKVARKVAAVSKDILAKKSPPLKVPAKKKFAAKEAALKVPAKKKEAKPVSNEKQPDSVKSILDQPQVARSRNMHSNSSGQFWTKLVFAALFLTLALLAIYLILDLLGKLPSDQKAPTNAPKTTQITPSEPATPQPASAPSLPPPPLDSIAVTEQQPEYSEEPVFLAPTSQSPIEHDPVDIQKSGEIPSDLPDDL